MIKLSHFLCWVHMDMFTGTVGLIITERYGRILTYYNMLNNQELISQTLLIVGNCSGSDESTFY